MLVPNSNMRRLLESRLREYHQQFLENNEALTIWEERGLTKKVAEEFLVGFVSEPLKGDARYKGRLAIPYITANGLPVAFKFRAIDDNPTRFMKDKGDPNRIFNTRILRRARKIVVTEGEIDAISAAQAGLQAVGIPGANNWKSEWGRIFFNREVTVLGDGDDAGREFAEMVATKLYGARVLDLPDGEDVNTLLQKKGSEYLWDMVVS